MLISGGALVNKSVFQLVRHWLERLFRDVQGARFHRPQGRHSSVSAGGWVSVSTPKNNARIQAAAGRCG